MNKNQKKIFRHSRAMQMRIVNELRTFCQEFGIKFSRFENAQCVHIRVQDKIDFWPSSEKFFDLSTKIHGKGIDELIDYLCRLKNELNFNQENPTISKVQGHPESGS